MTDASTRHGAAQALALEAGRLSDSPEALDLLARIEAQQGRMQEAADLWTRLLAIRPGHQGATAGLRRITTIQARAVRRGARLLPIGAWAILVVAVFGIGRMVSDSMSAIRADLQRILARQEAPATSGGDAVAMAPRIAIAVDGVRTAPDGADVILSFEHALFERGTRLAPEAQERLAVLARQLEPYASSITVSITGRTDDLPVTRSGPYRDNASLALARAAVVADTLRRRGTLPVESFSIRAAPSQAGTGRAHAAHRTADIRLSMNRP